MTTHTHAESARIATRLLSEEDPEFQIAPMIDILLILLVFFMSISSTDLLGRLEGLTLPVAKDAPMNFRSPGQMVINVLWGEESHTGLFEVDDEKFENGAHLLPKLQSAVSSNPRMRVLIRADHKVRYEFLKQIMVVAEKVGVKDVTFSVVDKDETR